MEGNPTLQSKESPFAFELSLPCRAKPSTKTFLLPPLHVPTRLHLVFQKPISSPPFPSPFGGPFRAVAKGEFFWVGKAREEKRELSLQKTGGGGGGGVRLPQKRTEKQRSSLFFFGTKRRNLFSGRRRRE